MAAIFNRRVTVKRDERQSGSRNKTTAASALSVLDHFSPSSCSNHLFGMFKRVLQRTFCLCLTANVFGETCTAVCCNQTSLSDASDSGGFVPCVLSGCMSEYVRVNSLADGRFWGSWAGLVTAHCVCLCVWGVGVGAEAVKICHVCYINKPYVQ